MTTPKTHANLQKNSAPVSRGVGNRTQPDRQDAQRAPSTPSVKSNSGKGGNASVADSARDSANNCTLKSRDGSRRARFPADGIQALPTKSNRNAKRELAAKFYAAFVQRTRSCKKNSALYKACVLGIRKMSRGSKGAIPAQKQSTKKDGVNNTVGNSALVRN